MHCDEIVISNATLLRVNLRNDAILMGFDAKERDGSNRHEKKSEATLSIHLTLYATHI